MFANVLALGEVGEFEAEYFLLYEYMIKTVIPLKPQSRQTALMRSLDIFKSLNFSYTQATLHISNFYTKTSW